MEYKRTKYVNRLIDRKNNGLIKVITGARRSGKSYLLNELFYSSLIAQGISKKNIIRFSFDSDEDIDLLDEYLKDTPSKIKSTNNEIEVNSKKFRAYIKDKTNENEDFYLFLDEIQLLENFIGTLNGLLKHKNFDIYVTGSNSRFLSSDIATEFKGRGTIIHVLPLVFSEYVENTQQDITKAWKDYIVTGGIPLVANMQKDEEKNNYLKLLAEETYLKDIIQRHNLKKKNEIGDTFNILASTIGAPLNIRRITNTFKSVMNKDISELTISNFIDYFEDAFVISKAQKYNIKGRKYIGSPFKLYFEDVGVRNARLNFRQIEETHLMENIIYNELRYRGFNVDVGEVNVSEKTERTDVNGKNIYEQKKLEVDFIASKGNEKYYIQSALSMSDPEKQLQEKRSLYYIDDSFKKIVVSRTGLKPSFDEKGILVVDLFDFLLNEKYMT
ncbi:MAG: ATP-binding protein [Succinivibrio sp.]|uniref:ATP-binding protein n=1 Tax=uncultured Succinivibrio sp. TaxID=540749 RepID=UPI0025EC8604|nr:ATP-binding protein [uncultured Succinivibrio sp.]MBQ3883845.1 ATP-binding protein [Succinivibrio sp.]